MIAEGLERGSVRHCKVEPAADYSETDWHKHVSVAHATLDRLVLAPD